MHTQQQETSFQYILNEKEVEKEKLFAEKLNGRFAMLGFVAAVGAYLTTGQIIPGLCIMTKEKTWLDSQSSFLSLL